jgi:streptogramin lyase
MTDLQHDDLDTRVRASLERWAERAPIPVDRLDEIEHTPRTARSPRPRAALLAAAAVIAVMLIAVALARPTEDMPDTTAGPGGVQARVLVGSALGVRSIAVGTDAIWVVSANDGMLYRVDPTTNERTASFDVGSGFEGVAEAGDVLWLSGADGLVAVDESTGARLATTDLPDGDVYAGYVAFGAVWAAVDGAVLRFDPLTGEERERFATGRSPGFMLATDDELWVSNVNDDSVIALDPETGDIVHEIDVGYAPRALAVDDTGAVWVSLSDADEVVRLDRENDSVDARVAVGRYPHGIDAVGNVVWVTNFLDGTVTRIDTDTAGVIGTHPVGRRPGSIRYAFGSVWVTSHRDPALLRLDPAARLDTAVAPSISRLVDVGDGRSIYLRCSGVGPTTVVLVPDIGEDAGSMPLVEARLARSTRVCATDPAGTSRSTVGPAPRTAEALASDLRAALDGAGVTGPFVLVGDGYGALTARWAASDWPDVTGVVLVKPVSPTFLSRVRAVLDGEDLAGFEQQLRSSEDLSGMAASEDVSSRSFDVPVVMVLGDDTVDDPDDVAPRADIIELLDELEDEDATRLEAETVVAVGDPRPPTIRPDAVVDAVRRLL